VAAALSGQVLLYKKGEAPQPVMLKQAVYFVVGNSGATSDTKDMVGQVARQHKRDPKKSEEIFEAIGTIALTGKDYLASGHLLDFGQLMDMNHSLLSSLMLCTKSLDEMCSTARKAGALGAKLTGSGGGGCMIALASNEEDAKKIEESLRALGRDAFVTKVPN
jgi:mevalonate kinase